MTTDTPDYDTEADQLAKAMVHRSTWPSLHWKMSELHPDAAHALVNVVVLAGWRPPATAQRRVTQARAEALRAAADEFESGCAGSTELYGACDDCAAIIARLQEMADAADAGGRGE